MGAAAVISWAEGREQKQRVQIRQQRHEQCEQWLETVAEQVKEAKATLAHLTRAVGEVRQEVTGPLSTALLAQRYRAEPAQAPAPCPQCGRQGAARGVVTRKVETVVGEVERARPYCYGVPCGQGWAPLDTALGVAPGRTQFDVPQAAATRAAEGPDESAQDLVAELRGVGLRTARLPELSNTVAAGLSVVAGAPPRAEILAKSAAVAAGRRWRPRGGWASEGADLPTRPEAATGRRPGRKTPRAPRARGQGQWREAQGLRFYLGDDDRSIPLLRWQQSQDHEELFAARRQGKEAGLSPADQLRLGVVAEGAQGIGQGVPQPCPTAAAIRDYYPCAEPVHQRAAVH